MLTAKELSIDKNSEGAWRISAVVSGYLETRRYYGYTKREAVALYLAEFNN
jgi:hypothetical protein